MSATWMVDAVPAERRAYGSADRVRSNSYQQGEARSKAKGEALSLIAQSYRVSAKTIARL